MSQMEGITYTRPMPTAAARAAALRAKMAGAGYKLPGSAAAAMSRGPPANPTYLVALDKFTSVTEKWLESIEQLRESAQKQQLRRVRPDDPAASGDERVHKTPRYKLLAARKKAEDVMMKEASRVLDDDDDSGKSVGSNDRIRPSTPPNLPKIVLPPATVTSKPTAPISTPRIPDAVDGKDEAKKPDTFLPTASSTTTTPAPPSSDFITQGVVPTTLLFRPPVTAQTSVASIPPTPPVLTNPPLATPGETSRAAEPMIVSVPPTIVAPIPRSISAENGSNIDTSVKSVDALSTSSAKKRRLSSKTILESLMEKKARNAIWYDGATQKVFHDMVFEMSQQIQSMKREGRIVMFAKDPACRNLLVGLDNMLQKSLRIVEMSSFLFLKGKADINQVDTLKTDLTKSLKDIVEFKKSGWTMANNDDDDDDDDDDSDSDNDESSE
ncbi:hypothetical protein AA313_de0207843 [Arthrobotrys entomopaga]|nr:hypothetical protein AA313_de0207843 [Arthrobotrys entomopaga]